MVTDKINKKYFGIAWLALILACFIRNIFSIYVDIVSITEPGRVIILRTIFSIIFYDGLIPAVVTFICALVVWQIGFFRYVRCISRRDFCTLAMLFTAAARCVVGFIEVFAILDTGVYVFTSTVLDFTLLSAAMLTMFLVVINKRYRLNPVERYNAFRLWSMIYMIVAGLGVFCENGLILLLADPNELSSEVVSLLYQLGYPIELLFSKIQIASCAIAIVVYIIFLVAVIVLGEVFRKQSKLYRDPETRGEYYEKNYNRGYSMRNDSDSVFGSDGVLGDNYYSGDSHNGDSYRNNDDGHDDHVFDEFDL